MTDEIVLTGIDGSNPLGFMTALGAFRTLVGVPENTRARMYWSYRGAVWQPVLQHLGVDREKLTANLLEGLREVSTDPFEIDKKLPFSAEKFSKAIGEALSKKASEAVRLLSLFAAFGSEAITDNEGAFLDTDFRMVRSGDNNGQGMLHYALQIRDATTKDSIDRALFDIWDYRDMGSSFRWDPLEDQRYALRADNPNSERASRVGIRLKGQPKMVLGANSLALEALAFFPTVPMGAKVLTTGFHVSGKKKFFTWPIWDTPIGVDAIQSTLQMRDLHGTNPSHDNLLQRGICEIYRCHRFAPNQYYKNFSTAWSP